MRLEDGATPGLPGDDGKEPVYVVPMTQAPGW